MIEGLKPYPEYKESGLPWLGRCPKNWSVRRTKILFHERAHKGFPNEPLLAATQTKGVVKKEDYETRTVTAQKDLHLLKLVEVGDYVISLRSFQGGIEVAHCRGIISPAYTVLKPRKQATSGYYSHFFKAKPFIDSLSLFVTGIREGQNIDYERLSRAELPMPSEDEQAAIVRFLDHANRKIDGFIRAKRKLIGLLNEQKQAIIHRAVTGKDEVRMVKDENGNSSFILQPSTLPKKPSGIPWLGDIPMHWEMRRLRFCIVGKLSYGANAAAEFDNPDWPRYLRITDFNNDGSLRSNTFRSLPPDVAKDYPVEGGDILFARSGATVGKAFLVSTETEKACYAGYLIRARPNTDVVLPTFLFAFTQSTAFAYWKDAIFNRATIQNIGADKYANLIVPIPPIAEQQAILDFIEKDIAPLRTAIARTEREIALMQEYRTRLTADLVTGKLDVREAAAKLPDLPTDASAAPDEPLEENEPEEVEA